MRTSMAWLAAALILWPASAHSQQAPGPMAPGEAGTISRPPSSDPVPHLVNVFNPYLQVTLRGGMTAGATCINFEGPLEGGPTGGDITISDVPAGATVFQAILYYTVLSDQFPVPSGTPTIDGNPLTPVPLGTVPRSPCFSQANTGAFRIDVTPYVTGNGTYQLDGMVGTGVGGGDITEGATLLVLYCDPDSELTDIVIYEGIDTINETERVFQQDLAGFQVDPNPPAEAFLAMAAGNGQLVAGSFDGNDPLYFNGVNLDVFHPEILSGGACPGFFYDLTAYDVSDWISPGDTTAVVRSELDQDCYTFAAIGLAVRTDPDKGDVCQALGCGGALLAPGTLSSCDGGPVTVSMDNTFTRCPEGPVESATQDVDPITARNGTTTTDLTPATAAASAIRATLGFDLTGDTDLVACVGIDLEDPSGTVTPIKTPGTAVSSPVDVTALYTGPGLYRIHLSELQGCGSTGNRFATLTATRLDVIENAGTDAVEYRVETAGGAALCDWSTDVDCEVPVSACPGEEPLRALARCVWDPSCGAGTDLRAVCSDIGADFSYEAVCGESEICFDNLSGGAVGPIESSWDFDGLGSSQDPDPCFDFGADGGPWNVTLQVSDESGCSSQTTLPVEPVTAPPAPEPSDLDLAPGDEPLRVVKRGPRTVELSWEALAPEFVANVYRGDLGNYYSHDTVGVCGLTTPSAILGPAAGSHYYLAVGANCAREESSYGRGDAVGERPAAAAPCP